MERKRKGKGERGMEERAEVKGIEREIKKCKKQKEEEK